MTSTSEVSYCEHKYKNGNWPLEDLDAASADIAAGATYSEATEGRQISRATLHSRVHKKYGDCKKPKRGPQYKLGTKHELHLVQYTNFCWDRNIPKTEEMLGPEIANYLDFEGIPNRFKHGIPGRTWFRNLRQHHSDLRIATKDEASKFRYMNLSEKEWIADRSYFIRSQSGEADFPTARHIFMIEVDSIHNAMHPHLKFDVLVAYNAHAEVLMPFILYQGDLSANLQHFYRECFGFIETTDGHVDHKSLNECIQYVDRFIVDQKLTYPAIIYLQPEVAEYFNFSSWMLTNEGTLLVNPIPRCVYMWMKTAGLGLFAIVKAKIHPLLLKRIWAQTDDPAREIILKALHEVLVKTQRQGHIKAGFQRMKILTLKKTQKPKPDILHELLGRSNHFRKRSADVHAWQNRKRQALEESSDSD